MTTNVLKPGWYHIIALKNGLIYQCVFERVINGAVFLSLGRLSIAMAPATPVLLGEIAWAIPVIEETASLCDYNYEDAKRALFGEAKPVNLLP
jgi:hypothetical protein